MRGRIQHRETKTGKGKRTIILPKSTADLLRRRKQNALSEWILHHPVKTKHPTSPHYAYVHLKTLQKPTEESQPVKSNRRKPGTRCVTQINDHLWEGRYSPKWIDGKKRSRNIYAHTREECEEKLVVLIREMKAELAQLKAQAV